VKRDDLCHAVRQRLVRLPEPFAAHYGVVPLAPPEEAIDLRPVRGRYEQAIQALVKADLIAQALHDPYILSRILTRREAVSSSSIEGTHSTLDALLSVEESEDGEASAATRQVRGYALALDTLVPRAQSEGRDLFSIDLMRELHRIVMRDDPDYADEPGEERQRVVWIGGAGNIAYSTFNPPPPDRVMACLVETVDYLRGQGMQGMTQGLLTQMAVAHAHFEAVHPFRDGNGRVGRLLLPLMMAADGHVPLYLSPYIEAHKGAYYEALKVAQQQLDWAGLVGFLADAVTATVDELEATRTALATLKDLWLQRRRFRRNSAAVRALDVLPHYPVITVGRLATLLDVSFPAAAQAVDHLQAAGILVERTGHTRNRIFAAEEAVSILNRPFGAEPIVGTGAF